MDSPHSGAYAAYAPDVGDVSDQQLTLSDSIDIPLSAYDARVGFWQLYDFDAEGSTAWDGGVLEISANGGPWNAAAITQGEYNGVLVNCPSLNPLAGREAWVGSSGGWVQTYADLTQYRGSNVRFRFRLGTSETVGGGGWWIDDLGVTFTPGFCWTPTVTATPCSPVPCTATSTSSPTHTLTPTLTPCPLSQNYTFTTTTGASIVAGTGDIGNHCDDCLTNLELPFSFGLYGMQFTSANVGSNGDIQFSSSYAYGDTGCLPSSSLSNAILAHWDDIRTDQTGNCSTYGAEGCGIFASVSGSAPNRIFNMEWRTVYFNYSSQLANFEVRLYEGQNRFEVIYGRVDQSGAGATTGVLRDSTKFTQYSCSTSSLSNGRLVTYVLPNLCPPAVTSTPTTTNTRTYTLTPTITATPTNTPTGTNTYTPTNTRTYTWTPTVTTTPSDTPTNTASATPTVTNTPTFTPFVTYTPVAGPALVGHVVWQGRPAQPNNLQILPVTLTLKSAATEVNYAVRNTDPSGFFSVSVESLVGDNYMWRVKGFKWLANSGTVVLAGEPSVSVEMGLMRAGDADDNNAVSVGDFNIVKGTFGKSIGVPGYDDRADFTGDRWVSIADFNLLKGNFGQGGAPPIGPRRD